MEPGWMWQPGEMMILLKRWHIGNLSGFEFNFWFKLVIKLKISWKRKKRKWTRTFRQVNLKWLGEGHGTCFCWLFSWFPYFCLHKHIPPAILPCAMVCPVWEYNVFIKTPAVCCGSGPRQVCVLSTENHSGYLNLQKGWQPARFGQLPKMMRATCG